MIHMVKLVVITITLWGISLTLSPLLGLPPCWLLSSIIVNCIPLDCLTDGGGVYEAEAVNGEVDVF